MIARLVVYPIQPGTEDQVRAWLAELRDRYAKTGGLVHGVLMLRSAPPQLAQLLVFESAAALQAYLSSETYRAFLNEYRTRFLNPAGSALEQVFETVEVVQPAAAG